MKTLKDKFKMLVLDVKLILIKIKINIISLRIAWQRVKENVNLF